MGNIERMTVTITADMAQAIRGAVKEGGYASSSEIIREALRDWRYKRQLQKRQLEQLRADVQVGLDDIEAGRVRAFDADRIVKIGEQRSNHSPFA